MSALVDILIALSVLAICAGIAMRLQFKQRPVSAEHRERMNELAEKVSVPEVVLHLEPMPKRRVRAGVK